jgi:hypothetical protein
MNLNTDITAIVWSLFATIAIAGIWVWAVSGWSHLAHSSYGRVVRGRNVAVCCGLLSVALGALLSLPVFPVISNQLAGFLGAVGVCLHTALDPMQEGFWHHRRMRYVITSVLLVGGVMLSIYFPIPALVPVIAASVVYHRHQQARSRMTALCLQEIELLRMKLLSFQAAQSGADIPDHSPQNSVDDNLANAS